MRFAKLISLVMSAAFGLSAFSQSALDVNYAGEDLSTWGTNKAETYDVAVYLNDASVVGAEIIGVELPAVVGENTENWSVWMSSALGLENKQNVADIVSVSATPVDGKISVTFDSPYKLTEQGVYVGYSFTVTSLTDKTREPISVGTSSNSAAFNIHTSKTYLKWRELGKELALNMTVKLRGSFVDDAVSLVALQECGDLCGEVLKPIMTVKNSGVNDVASLEYKFTIDGQTFTKTQSFSPALSASTAETADFALALTSVDEPGTYPCSVEVISVNGKPNEAVGKAQTVNMYAYPYRPAHLPLIEDYTGTWCGWCPRGSFAIDALKAELGEQVISVVYHVDDILTITPNPYVANSGVPGAYLDRGSCIDPYYGSLSDQAASQCLSYKDGIKQDWLVEQAKISPAEISLQLKWEDDAQSIISARSTVKFLRPYTDADFRVMYIVVNEELVGSGRSWYQKNYYSGEKAYLETDLAPLVELPSEITDIAFHDVAILAPDTYGIEGSLPSEIQYLEELTHTKLLDLSQAVPDPETAGRNPVDLVQDKSKIYVVASIYDAKTRRVVNSTMRKLDVESGVDAVVTDESGNGEIEWFNLQGIAVDSSDLSSGVYIRRCGNSVNKVVVR